MLKPSNNYTVSVDNLKPLNFSVKPRQTLVQPFLKDEKSFT